MTTIASAVFASTDSARTAIGALRNAGVSESSISVIGNDGTPRAADGDRVMGSGIDVDRVVDGEGEQRLTEEGENHAMRGVLGGGALGALVGVALLAIPVFGQVVAAGAIAAAGAGFLVGAGAGGLGEILTHNGVLAEDAAFYEGRVAQGGVIVMVDDTAGLDAVRIDSILAENGGDRAPMVGRTAVAA